MPSPLKNPFRIPGSEMVVERRNPNDTFAGYEESGPDWDMPIFVDADSGARYTISRPRDPTSGAGPNNPLDFRKEVRPGIWKVSEIAPFIKSDPSLASVLAGKSVPGEPAAPVGGQFSRKLENKPFSEYFESYGPGIASMIFSGLAPESAGFWNLLGRATIPPAAVGAGARLARGGTPGEALASGLESAAPFALLEAPFAGYQSVKNKIKQHALDAALRTADIPTHIEQSYAFPITRREVAAEMAQKGMFATAPEITGSPGLLKVQHVAESGLPGMVAGVYKKGQETLKNMKAFMRNLNDLLGPETTPADFAEAIKSGLEKIRYAGEQHFQNVEAGIRFASHNANVDLEPHLNPIRVLRKKIAVQTSPATEMKLATLNNDLDNIVAYGMTLNKDSTVKQRPFATTLAYFNAMAEKAAAAPRGSLESEVYSTITDTLKKGMDVSLRRTGSYDATTRALFRELTDGKKEWYKDIADAKLKSILKDHLDRISSDVLGMGEVQSKAMVRIYNKWSKENPEFLGLLQRHVMGRMVGEIEEVMGTAVAQAKNEPGGRSGAAAYIESKLPAIRALFDASPEGKLAINGLSRIAEFSKWTANRLNPRADAISSRRFHWAYINLMELAAAFATFQFNPRLGMSVGLAALGGEWLTSRILFNPKATSFLIEGMRAQRFNRSFSRGVALMTKAAATVLQGNSVAVSQMVPSTPEHPARPEDIQKALDRINQINQESVADTQKRIESVLPAPLPEVSEAQPQQED